jgi:hypothetical protein
LTAKLAFTTGVLGALVVLLLVLLGGATFPNYSPLSQFISELGARGAPHGRLVSLAGFLPAGMLLGSFGVFASQVLPSSRVTLLGLAGIAYYALGYGVAAFFPCDPGCRPVEPSFSQAVHNLVGGTSYFAGAAALIALGVQARSWPDARHLSALGVLGGGVAMVACAFLSPTFQYVGLAQRVLEACVLSWVVACAFYLKHHPSLGSPRR